MTKNKPRKIIKVKLTEEGYKKLKKRTEENCRFVSVQAGIDIERVNEEKEFGSQFLIPKEKVILERRLHAKE